MKFRPGKDILNFLSVFWGSKSAVVIDIGPSLLKILQVVSARGKKEEAFLRFKPVSEIREPLHEAIPKILTEAKLKNRRVTTYLPRNMVNMRLIEIPSTDAREIDDIVKMQAVKQTPYSRDEVAISYTVAGSRQEGCSDVILVFCQRKFVDERLYLLERSGLKVDRIGISSEGVLHWYAKNLKDRMTDMPKGVVVIVENDSASADVVFCKDGNFAFSRSFSTDLTDRTSPELTEKYCNELRRIVELTMDETGLDRPKKMVLAGSVKKYSHLREKLEETLQMPVELIDPLRDLNLAHDFEGGDGSVSSLIGFSRQEIKPLFDLTPEDAKLRRRVEEKGRQFVMTGGLVLALMGAILVFLAGSFYKRAHYLRELEKNIEKTSGAAGEIEDKAKRLKFIQRRTNADKSVLKYLKEISGVLPASIYFGSVDYADGDKIMLKGYAEEMSDVFNYVKILEELKIFKGVKSEQVSKKKVGDKNMSEFEIVCNL